MRLSDYSQSGGRGLFRRDRRIYDKTGTFTFLIPDGVTKVWAFAIGAGGGGAYTSTQSGILKGGEGGGYASGIISGLTPGGTLTVTVGAHGEGGDGIHTETDGGNTTLAGGGTTYLTANGGDKAPTSKVTSDNGTQVGQGGSASTSGVTDAYTAAGGGGGQYSGGAGINDMSPSQLSSAYGGGSSGTPNGPGCPPPRIIMKKYCAAGGGGWAQMLPTYDRLCNLNSGSWTLASCPTSGAGSHTIPQIFGATPSTSNTGTTGWQRGGDGQKARGGISYNLNAATGTDNDQYRRFQQFLVDSESKLHGEDGNPNWWFPWEIDGGGGGSLSLTTYQVGWKAGNGGPGAGGGGAYGEGSDVSIAAGGDGGFGGGGGGALNTGNNNTKPNLALGGRGGNGGGGGSVWSDTGSNYGTIQSGKGGDGGDGAIGIYW